MRAVLLIVRAGVVVVAIGFVATLLVDGGPRAGPAVTASRAGPQPPAVRKPVVAAKPKKPVPRGAAAEIVAIVAVGDIVMGVPGKLPPDGGRSFFRSVQTDLAGDVVFGNLEGTLSVGGTAKCKPRDEDCFAFQTPPSYARWLRRAGFTIMNLANNHGFDFGRDGRRQTAKALDGVGIAHTGRMGQITVQQVGAVRVALLGFGTDPWTQRVTDLTAARDIVRRAAKKSDLVVVTMHMGAEGSKHQHVRPGTERFLGENRGDPIRFAHTVVDAGADLVVGHGPHVLRGMEWYKDRLIAYSLGNFAGYGVFALGGPLSVSAILRVELRGDGSYEGGLIVPTRLAGRGLPVLDPEEEAHRVIRTLSRADFGARGAKISPEGLIRKYG
jgi:poly-gamma-glutamate capsule biosynthesis protein CapA/YwtB (metallophosphatase superfamily)